MNPWCLLASLCGLVLPTIASAQSVPRGLSLQQAEVLLVERNRELALADRSVEAARADVTIAGVRPNPNLSVSTSSIAPGSIGAGSIANKRLDTVIGLSQLFERGGKRELRTAAAQALVGAAQMDRSEIGRTQRLLLQAAYYDLAGAQERVRITAAAKDLFEESLAALETRLRAGDVAAVDVSRMRVDALKASNDARAAMRDLGAARTALAYLLGLEAEADTLGASDALPAPDIRPGREPHAPDAAIEARADFRAAQARLAAAERQRDLARALRARDVMAGVQFERYPGSDPRNSVGFSVSVPLFTSHYYEGEIRRAEADVQIAREQLVRVAAQARTELARAASALASAADRSRRYEEQLLGAAGKAAEAAEFAYTRGAIGVMDLLDARRQLGAARLEAVVVRVDYARALAAWRAALTPAEPSSGRD